MKKITCRRIFRIFFLNVKFFLLLTFGNFSDFFSIVKNFTPPNFEKILMVFFWVVSNFFWRLGSYHYMADFGKIIDVIQFG